MTNFNFLNHNNRKVIFIMGPTGSGKSKLSIALATHFSAEIINSDKIQVYKGLDIITNKVPEHETRGVPHHLLGFVNPDEDYTAEEFCDHTLMAIHRIQEKGSIAIIVGGSNNYIKALVEDPKIQFRKNFDCCFLWTDVSTSVLHKYVEKRIDQMIELGLVDEVREMFDPMADYSRGIRRAIGAPEMHRYLEVEGLNMLDEARKTEIFNECIKEMKENTCKLVDRQQDKIRGLRDELGWKIHRIDSTRVFQRCGEDAEETWKKVVLKPSLEIVGEFLKMDKGHRSFTSKEMFSSLNGNESPRTRVRFIDLIRNLFPSSRNARS